MTDKELLGLAAKAAGFTVRDDVYHNDSSLFVGKGDGDLQLWNPLIDDGDALRLAVKLKIDILFDFDRIIACYGDGEREYETEYLYDKPVIPDHDAVTRRAIVRAAAEVGKAMK